MVLLTSPLIFLPTAPLTLCLIRLQGRKKMKRSVTVSLLLPAAAAAAAAFFMLLLSFPIPSSQSPIPPKYDGFAYGDSGSVYLTQSVVIDAFLDPLCPDSSESWPPLKKVIQEYSPHISLVVHPFALPYHDNSYIACRALHIANKLNASTTYPLLELFFEDQGRFSNACTHNKSRESIIDDMVEFAMMAVGNSFLPAFKSNFEDPDTDLAARVSFKYGCSRGVYGTPFFFVNGFALPDAGSALDYDTWKNVIDPLVEKQWKGWEEPLLYL